MLISDKQKQILILLADGEFHSGTELAQLLGVSRSAICKQLNGLSTLGLQHSRHFPQNRQLARRYRASPQPEPHRQSKLHLQVCRLQHHYHPSSVHLPPQ